MSEVSILIPTYNSSKRLEICLNSILNQTFKDFELIICDGGSTDQTIQIINKYLNKDKRIKLFNSKVKGVSKQRNILISKANSKYIFFVDSDDRIDRNCLMLLMNKAKEGYDVVAPNFVVENEKTIKEDHKAKSMQFLVSRQNCVATLLSNGYYFGRPIKLFKTSFIGGVLFDETISFGEDLLFNIDTCKNKTFKYFISSEAKYYNFVPLNHKALKKYKTETKKLVLKLHWYYLNESNEYVKKFLYYIIFDQSLYFCNQFSFFVYFYFYFRFKMLSGIKYVSCRNRFFIFAPFSYKIYKKIKGIRYKLKEKHEYKN